jgi:hypothetical protein
MGLRGGHMKEKYTKLIKERVYNYALANYKKIDTDKFILGDIPYNQQCHYNSVQKVKEGKAAKVYACIAIDKSDWKAIIIHFINQLDDGIYQDNTWGWLYSSYDYYLIKEVDKSEYDDIWNLLDSIRKNLINSNSNGLLRKLLRIGKNFI